MAEAQAEQTRKQRTLGVVRAIGERFFIRRAQLLQVPKSQVAEVREQVREAETKADVALRAPSPLAENLAAESIRDLLLVVAGLRNTARSDAESPLHEAVAWVASEVKSPVLRGGLLASVEADAKKLPPASTLVAVASHVATLIDTRTPREILLKRATLLVALVLFGVFGAKSAFGARNLARGRMVTSSSVCVSQPPPPYRAEKLGRAVDGARMESTFAICTASEVRPWIMVDLARMRTITEVIVYARSDGWWGKEDLPLSVEISSDEKRFTTIGTTRVPFTDDSPWSFGVDNRRARYVRLTTKVPERRSIVISEIEVYGH